MNRGGNPQRENEMDSLSFEDFDAQLDSKFTHGNRNDDLVWTKLWNNLNTTYYNELELSKWVEQFTTWLKIRLKHITKYLI